MFDNVVDVLGNALGELRPVVGDLDVGALDPEVAAELVALGVEIEQLGTALRVLATQAVARGERWRREGFRSAAEWMAAQAGTPVRPAIATMEMARLLDGLPVVAAAFRAGRLSEAQAKEIVDAAAEVDVRRDDIIVDALRGRWYENADAHRADALVDLARTARGGSDPRGPEAMVHVWVDYEALMRGHTVAGERCEIPGLGPIPVTLARRMADDCILKVVVTRGVDITAVAHGGRTIPAHLRTALECRDPKCIVPQCTMRRGLQIDHRDPYAATRDTSLENTARLCRWHHYQKSHLGFHYRGGPGTWQWIPPDEPVGPPTIPP